MSNATLRIDLGAIAHNTAVLREIAGEKRLMCVVKANAYNHGVDRVVPVMDDAGADAFGVATFAEAERVRGLTDKPVLAWMWAPGESVPAGIEVGVPSVEHLRWLWDEQVSVPVHLMVDTGMNRSGIDEQHWEETFRLAKQAEAEFGLQVVGVMSHLACADEPADPYNDAQRLAFVRAIELAREHGLEVPVNHLANSPGTLTREDFAFEQVRTGVVLYGLDPVEAPLDVDGQGSARRGAAKALRPAMTWSAGLVAVKPISKGEGVSYGLTWTAPEDGWTAVVPVGYADGLPRAWQGAVEVTIYGRTYPQVGRVCMDQFVVWLGANEHGVRAGDEAIIFGEGGMSAAELARRAGTIHYEVVSIPGGRLDREYVG